MYRRDTNIRLLYNNNTIIIFFLLLFHGYRRYDYALACVYIVRLYTYNNKKRKKSYYNNICTTTMPL